MMEIHANGFAYSDQYFFVAISVDENGHVQTFLNGGNTRNTRTENNLFNLDTLSSGDFKIGSDKFPVAGYLSDIKVYNRVIDEKEILEIYKGW